MPTARRKGEGGPATTEGSPSGWRGSASPGGCRTPAGQALGGSRRPRSRPSSAATGELPRRPALGLPQTLPGWKAAVCGNRLICMLLFTLRTLFTHQNYNYISPKGERRRLSGLSTLERGQASPRLQTLSGTIRITDFEAKRSYCYWNRHTETNQTFVHQAIINKEKKRSQTTERPVNMETIQKAERSKDRDALWQGSAGNLETALKPGPLLKPPDLSLATPPSQANHPAELFHAPQAVSLTTNFWATTAH